MTENPGMWVLSERLFSKIILNECSLSTYTCVISDLFLLLQESEGGAGGEGKIYFNLPSHEKIVYMQVFCCS